MSDDRDILGAAVGLVSGVVLFFVGFHVFRKKQMIDNIPTSTVRGMAMGLVELIGRPRRKPYLKGPLSGEDCVIYTYKIQRYEQRGKNSRWVTIANGNSFDCSFDVEDDTGRVMVIPSGAEFISDPDYTFTTGWGNELPDNLVRFMQAGGISYHGLFGNYKLRFMEHHITPDEQVYVLGTARKINAPLEDQELYKSRLTTRLNQIKGDQRLMAEVDLNKDGNISEEEWQRVVSKVEEELIQNEIAAAATSGLPDVEIGQGDQEKIFIISDKSQKDLDWIMGWQAAGGVLGGAAMAVGCLWYLLFRFGVIH